MKLSDIVVVAALALIIAGAVWHTVWLYGYRKECDSKGGVTVRVVSFPGYECLEARRIP